MEILQEYYGKEMIFPDNCYYEYNDLIYGHIIVNEYYSFINRICKNDRNNYSIYLDINMNAKYEYITLVDDLYNGCNYRNIELGDESYLGFINNNTPCIINVDEYQLTEIINKVNNNELNERNRIINERQINELIHFTSINNLNSIIENGVLSRDRLSNYDGAICYDMNRFDRHTSYVNTSVSFPNYKMLYKLRKNNYDDKFVILGINSEILLNKLDVIFTLENAASTRSNEYFKLIKNFLSNYYAFDEIFKDENRSLLIPNKYPTNPQAEVMIKDIIEPEYINSIYYSGLDKNEEYNVNNLCLRKNINAINDNSLFGARIDYKQWKK